MEKLDSEHIHIVRTTDELERALPILSAADELSVDTESDSLFVYFEKVCLLQITAGDQSFIIDTLETGDLSSLAPLFASKDVVKIFHAAEYDFMCLKRDFGFEFNSLFDTMQSARILGRTQIGLGALIENEFGIHLEKKYQKSNWGLRPLSEDMLLYAANDTIYLSALKERLLSELKERGLDELAQEDFARMCKIPAGPSEPQETNWWRIAGNASLTDYQTAVLYNLCCMREEEAKKRDLPAYKVISNEGLLQIALTLPKNQKQLQYTKGVGTTAAQRYGNAILRIMADSKKTKRVPKPPVTQRPPESILACRERLKTWRKEKGLEMNVPSDVILPKDVMERIVTVHPENAEALASAMEDCPWRYARYGEEILGIL